MVFRTSSVSRNTPAAKGDTSWKADGFINVFVPAANSPGRSKIGFIPLYGSKEHERKLLEWLDAEPARIAKLTNNLTVNYVETDRIEGSDTVGFLNLSLPTEAGGTRNLGGIRIRDTQRYFVSQMESDAAAEALLGSIELVYHSATPAAGSGFALD